ncbi:MAG TPA: porin, partial [Hyphomicrobiaceae bacterium]|nr:porin [Hyphomicrobiaceae bacterium]
IDLGGIGVIAPGTVLVGNALEYTVPATGLPAAGASIGAGYDAAADYNKRIEGIRYDSPSLAGFQIGASYGEASSTLPYNGGAGTTDLGNAYAVNLRYAGEFSGVRLAAAIGYELINQDSIVNTANRPTRNTRIGGSLSMMHVPTGLFVQGSYTRFDSDLGADKRDGNVWHVAGGISQNWFGIGRTALYGEYGAGSDMFHTNRVLGAGAPGDSSRFWGLGMVQHIDAAAMELFVGYRNFRAEDSAGNKSNDIDLITGGARIRF